MSHTQTQQDPYEVATFCTALPSGQKQAINVGDGEELQQALDQASGGDVIALAEGATFRPVAPEGSFMLRNRGIAAGQWVTIRSSSRGFDAGGALRPSVRVDKANANVMPQIRATAVNLSAFRAEPGARGYRLIGLDIGVDEGVNQLANLVELGAGTDTRVDTEPSDIVIDRSYLHGNDRGDYRRGVAMNGVRLAVVDSYLENFHDAHSDSQAIGGWNGGTGGKLLRVTNGVSDVEITHITSTSNPNGILDPENTTDLNPNLVFKTTSSSARCMALARAATKGSRRSPGTSRRSSTTRTCW